MISSVSEVLATFALALWSGFSLVLEHLALWHQVMVMQRSRRRPQFNLKDAPTALLIDEKAPHLQHETGFWPSANKLTFCEVIGGRLKSMILL